jgi:hypothetical protein
MLAACTMMYARTYVVEPIEPLSPEQKQAVFHAFREYLVNKGLKPLQYGDSTDKNRIAFRIAGSTAGFTIRRDWEDILELSYVGDIFEMKLVRIVHHPADFTEKYLAEFVEKTEKFIQEATSRTVKLRLVSTELPI